MLATLTRSGRGTRVVCALALALTMTVAVSIPASAGPGHSGDEGHSHDAPVAASSQSPRIAATSENFQIVGILKGGALTIYVDREPDNVPVTTGKLSVAIGGETVDAAPGSDGTFEIAAKDAWTTPGEHEVQFIISAEDKTDLLGGVLAIPDRGQHTASAARGQTLALLNHMPSPGLAVAGLVLMGLGVLLGSLLPRRRRTGLASLAFMGASLLSLAPVPVLAGPGHSGDEGHSHGPEQAGGLSDSASRLADGSIFVPKPTQRLLDVRTRLASAESVRRAIRLPGRVIAGASGPVVEVALYDQVPAEQIRTANVVGPAGVTAAATLSSLGAELKQNAILLTFTLAPQAPAALLAIGQRVSVIVEAGEPVTGVVLPRAAVVTAPNGQSVVFEHAEPEKFVPKLVLFAPVDADRVVVTAGLAVGDKVVVEAASLINQIR